MASNLVTAGLLLGMISLLCLSRGTEGDSDLDATETAQDVIKDSLFYIKDFVQRKSTSRKLAMELGKLDADHVCTADGLAGLRKAVKLIRAKTWGKAKSLTKAINDYTKQAVKLCFEEANKEWTDEIDRDIMSNYSSLLNFNPRFLERDPRYGLTIGVGSRRNDQLIETALVLAKVDRRFQLVVSEYVAKMLRDFREEEEPDQPPVSASDDIERLIIEPCRKFSEDQNATKILKPLVDLIFASDHTKERPENRVAGWTARLMICQWFMRVGAKNLAVKSSIGAFYSYYIP